MLAMAPAGMAAIGGLFSLGSSLLGRSKRSSMDKVQQGLSVQRGIYERDVLQPLELAAFQNAEARAEEAQAWNRTAFNERNTAIQRTAADARAAGLHPLFALGGAVNQSPTFGVGGGDLDIGGSLAGGGQFDSGSAIGDVLAGVREAMGTYMQLEEMRDQRQVNKARAMRDTAEADYFAAMTKKATQEANSTRTYPLADRSAPEFKALPPPGKWPRKVNPQEAHRDRVTVVGDDGRPYNVPNPDVFEEVLSPATFGALWEYMKRSISELQYWGGLPVNPGDRW